jgi:hypothetical protein
MIEVADLRVAKKKEVKPGPANHSNILSAYI